MPPSLGKYSPVKVQVVTAVQEIASGTLLPFGAGVVSMVHSAPGWTSPIRSSPRPRSGITRSSREVTPEDSESLDRRAVGQGDAGGLADPGGPAHGGEQHRREQPSGQDEPAVPEVPASQPRHQQPLSSIPAPQEPLGVARTSPGMKTRSIRAGGLWFPQVKHSFLTADVRLCTGRPPQLSCGLRARRTRSQRGRRQWLRAAARVE